MYITHLGSSIGVIVTTPYDKSSKNLFLVHDENYDKEPFSSTTRSLLVDGVLVNLELVDRRPGLKEREKSFHEHFHEQMHRDASNGLVITGGRRLSFFVCVLQ